MTRIWIAMKDITLIEVDAIVCAANSGLVLGCGVAGAIWRRGGQVIQDECDRLGKLKPGEVGVTHGGQLPARHVFHAVSMGYQHPDVEKLLRGLTERCLEIAEDLGLTSVAFPAIAAGRMKLPASQSCRCMGGAIADHDFTASTLESVGFALLDPAVFACFESELPSTIMRNSNLEFSDEVPATVDLPWRTS